MNTLTSTHPHSEPTEKHGMALILATAMFSLALIIGCGIAFGWVEAGCVIAAEAITGGLFWIAFWSGRAGR